MSNDWRVPISFSSAKAPTRLQSMSRSASTPNNIATEDTSAPVARPRVTGPLLATTPSLLVHELEPSSSSSSSSLRTSLPVANAAAFSVEDLEEQTPPRSSASSSSASSLSQNRLSRAASVHLSSPGRSSLNASSPAVLVATTEDLDDEMAELMTIPRLPFEFVDDVVPSPAAPASSIARSPPPRRTPLPPVAQTTPPKDRKLNHDLVVGPPSPTLVRVDRSAVHKEEDVKWCSWCFLNAPQRKLEDRWVGRATLECLNCLNETVNCLMCSEGVCRSFGATADRLCYKCDGTYAKTKVPAALKMHGRCSHCFEQTSHSLHRAALVMGRDAYVCDGCGKRTLLCKSCQVCFARGTDEYDEELCAKCNRSIEDWGSGPPVGKSPASSRGPLSLTSDSSAGEEERDDDSIYGWCSWCISDARHELVSRSLLTRNSYRCSDCEHRTLCCTTCQDGMARGSLGFDDKCCVSCTLKTELAASLKEGNGRRGSMSGSSLKPWDWLTLKEKKDAVFDPARYTHNRVVTLLGLASPFKERAMSEGMIRPFLILVSMRPSKRNRVSNELGWSLIPSPLFGDAHAESWEIMSADNCGFQSRLSSVVEKLNPLGRKNLSWIECLERVVLLFGKLDPESNFASKLADGCVEESDKPYSQAVQRMEQIVMIRVGRLYHKYLLANNLKPPKGDKATSIMNKIKDATGLSDGYGLTWGASVFFKPKTGVPRFSDALDVFLSSRDDVNGSRAVLVCLEIIKQLLRLYIGFSVFVDDWYTN